MRLSYGFNTPEEIYEGMGNWLPLSVVKVFVTSVCGENEGDHSDKVSPTLVYLEAINVLSREKLCHSEGIRVELSNTLDGATKDSCRMTSILFPVRSTLSFLFWILSSRRPRMLGCNGFANRNDSSLDENFQPRNEPIQSSRRHHQADFWWKIDCYLFANFGQH